MSTHVNDNAASCDQVFATLPNETYSLAIQLGDTLEADKYNSVFMGMMEQVGKLRSSNWFLSKLVVEVTDIFLLISNRETQILATLGQMHLMVMIMRLLIGLTWVCSKEDFISQ